MDRARQLVHVSDEVIVLGAGARDAGRVAFLEGVGADQMCRDLSGQDHHRDGVHHRVGDRGDHVGRAGTGGDETDAGLAGRAGIAFGGVAGALFVAHKDVADAIGIVEGVIDVWTVSEKKKGSNGAPLCARTRNWLNQSQLRMLNNEYYVFAHGAFPPTSGSGIICLNRPVNLPIQGKNNPESVFRGR